MATLEKDKKSSDEKKMKKSYKSPTLVEYGTIAKLTQLKTGTAADTSTRMRTA